MSRTLHTWFLRLLLPRGFLVLGILPEVWKIQSQLMSFMFNFIHTFISTTKHETFIIVLVSRIKECMLCSFTKLYCQWHIAARMESGHSAEAGHRHQPRQMRLTGQQQSKGRRQGTLQVKHIGRNRPRQGMGQKQVTQQGQSAGTGTAQDSLGTRRA